MTKAPRPDPPVFAGLGLDSRLVAALAALGYEEPTPIQAEAIPLLLAGRDMLAQAATGTGKTAAFALPLLQRLAASTRTSVFGVILVPTRELAMQVAEAVHKYGRAFEARVLAVYGGQALMPQVRALDRGVDVVVATPGRALDLLGRGSLKLAAVRSLVLDEADEMLDMGFAEDLESILSALPADRQTALFSATLPPRIAQLAERHLNNPARIEIQRESSAGEGASAARVKQTAYLVPRAYKMAALSRILDVENPGSALVFCRTRTEVDEVTGTLNARGLRAEALHGGMSQEQRDRVMKRFRAGTAELLIATDVAARGLDIEQLSHVVNYDVPSAPEAYVHRIGRTGRAGRAGTAITLMEPREQWQLRILERLTRQKIEVAKLPTVADLKARRLELTRASLQEALVGGELDRFRVVVESLAEEFDVLDVAAAGVKLAYEASGPEREEPEIPVVMPPPPPRPFTPRPGVRPAGPFRPAGAARTRAPGDAVKLWISAGREAGIRPADLVGAIANEAKVEARRIGAIQIADRFSLVEVPADAAEAVLQALKRTKLRGQKIFVRRDRDEG